MTSWTAAHQPPQSSTIPQNLLKFTSNELVILFSHVPLCHPLFLLPAILPSINYFPMIWLFTLGGQSTGVSASASVLSMNIQDWFPLGLTGLISSQSKEFSRVFSSTTVWKHQFFTAQPSLWSNSHICKGQTLSPKFIFRPSALPRSFTWISVELSVSFCYVCIFCPHWVWFVLFLRTSTMIYWPLCPISFQIYSAPCVVLEPAGCLIDIFESSTPMNKACSF